MLSDNVKEKAEEKKKMRGGNFSDYLSTKNVETLRLQGKGTSYYQNTLGQGIAHVTNHLVIACAR